VLELNQEARVRNQDKKRIENTDKYPCVSQAESEKHKVKISAKFSYNFPPCKQCRFKRIENTMTQDQ